MSCFPQLTQWLWAGIGSGPVAQAEENGPMDGFFNCLHSQGDKRLVEFNCIAYNNIISIFGWIKKYLKLPHPPLKM